MTTVAQGLYVPLPRFGGYTGSSAETKAYVPVSNTGAISQALRTTLV